MRTTVAWLAARIRGGWPALLVVLAVTVGVVWLGADDAWARVGGGQGFNTGSGSGGFSGGGRGGDDGGMIMLLIWLLIEHPAIGVPVLLVVVAVVIVRALMNQGGRRQVVHHTERAPAARPVDGVQALRADDPAFSMPVLLDFLQLLHRRATAAAPKGDWDALLPFVSEQARSDLSAAHRGVTEVRDVVAGGIQIMSAQRDQDAFVLQVVVQDTRRESLEGGGARHVYVEESWSLARRVGARSPTPDDAVRMGCPSCGAAIDTDRTGRCVVCETAIVDGLLQWRAERVAVLVRRRIEAPQVGWATGGAEPGFHMPTVLDPELGRAWRAFVGRHPGFDGPAFQERVKGIFLALQAAWSAGDWDVARPHVTDTLYQTLRFYLEQYAEHDLKNRLGDVQLLKQEVVKVQVDAWYESITVRIWGEMRDWIENGRGEVVGGNDKRTRQFSEYWTFIRAIGSGDASVAPTGCPSCGAPLDRISQTGICGYCESKITTGQFDWVLSRIDQPQVYRG
jgi:predicted lipid-binding transport protein (Tim44 family)